MRTIKQVLMDRDGMTNEDAQDIIDEAKKQLARYLDDGDLLAAEDICAEFFGLEPDYVEELIPL